MFVCLFFPQTTCEHVCFSKCLSILFFSKLHAHLSVFRNVCPFVFSPNCILLFLEMFVRSFFSKLHLLFFEKIVHLFFLKSLSFSLFFCQIFSSRIISKTRKTCRRTKGNLLALLQESPQVFGIARLSEVRTIQISHKKNPILWVEKAEKQQIRDSCALYLYTYVYIYIYIYTWCGLIFINIQEKHI